jgi:hypothetical protein
VYFYPKPNEAQRSRRLLGTGSTPVVIEVDNLDHQIPFVVQREATAKVTRKALRNEPT